ncbi:N-acetylmuramidase domain-containing protein [Novosphingobium sp. M1R2S20]|uniref:N-acetylmuramidase domain-containing protein n=1 Tax=Novosphingobium rhizovicinum TaxID=3228928 RepID=A0ABV3RD23_9SPHN
MRDEFTGNPAPLEISDYVAAARELGCSVAALRAVAHVESAGSGFLPNRRPKILFERHIFHRRTRGEHSAAHPHISSARPGAYLGGAREYERLHAAMALNRTVALESASWGKFQIMGFNHALCGHEDVESFVAGMVAGEGPQLATFTAFLKSAGLADELRRCDWAGFARGYNGPAYAAHAYDRKIGSAHARFLEEECARPLLKLGDQGDHVAQLQTLLGARADGAFGPLTLQAVLALQKRNGISADGIVGPVTWARLLA